MEQPNSTLEISLDGVIAEVRALAEETGGDRARRAATETASFEREIGLGSLERVELLSRLERRFRVRLPESLLQADTCVDLVTAANREAGATTLPRATNAPGSVASEVQGDPEILDIPETLDRALALRAERSENRITVFLTEDDETERNITYGDLFAGASQVAAGLAARGISKGDRVALMLPTGFDFLRTFQGTLLCGAIAVPIYPPLRLDRLAEYAERQAAILKSAGVKILVTIARGKPIAHALRSSVPTLESVVTAEELATGASSRLRMSPQAKASDAAFIQYTSGSTGSPKGVLLTHANLMANVRAIAHGTDSRASEVGVSWLPLYHDMGLIGSWLFTMVYGFPLALRSPLSFLSRPERWLWDVHKRRGTLSAAPNFAYELCVKRIRDEDIEGLDLSSWKCALNGAEPVRPETLDRFISRFSKHGFRREAMFPVFGLAENSVALAFPPVLRGPKIDRVDRAAFERGHAKPSAPHDSSANLFVSSGSALPQHEIKIVDETGQVVEERRVGRLLFRGPSMTSGYFENPEATSAMQAGDGFLDTGDLAYIADGELYIAGRKKDLIIRAGRNLVPAEIEEAASEVEGVRRGCVAAFGAPDPKSGTEQVVVVAESRAHDPATRDRIEAAIIERVGSALGIPPDVVRLVPPGVVPKTSSGKIRRSDTRALYLAGKLGRTRGDSRFRQAALALQAARGFSRGVVSQIGRVARGAYLFGALTVASPALFLVLQVSSPRRARRLEQRAARLASRLIGLRTSLEGGAFAGPALLVCNHASYLDVIVLRALLPSEFVFVAKREVLKYPLIGTFMRRSKHIAVERFDAQASARDADQVREALGAGETVLVFPEGTFTHADGLRPFRLGAFKSAAEAGVPIIPMALRGTRKALRAEEIVPRPSPVSLWVGQPLSSSGDSFRDLVALRDLARKVIGDQCGEPVLDLVAAGPERPL